MKAYKFYSLDLTTKNNLEGGFFKRHDEVTKEDLTRALKNVMESIRRKTKTKRGINWKYCILAVISDEHLSKKTKKGDWHIHLIVYGSPASTISKDIKAYWTRHGYGNSIQQELKACWDWKKVKYDFEQVGRNVASKNMKLYQHGIKIQELQEILINAYPPEQDYKKIMKNLRLNTKTITKRGFINFAMCAKDGWTPRSLCVTK